MYRRGRGRGRGRVRLYTPSERRRGGSTSPRVAHSTQRGWSGRTAGGKLQKEER